MTPLWRHVLILWLTLSGAMVWAQQEPEDLRFPTEPSTFSAFGRPKMALYKPDGAGPFPALVLFHQCGGLGSRVPNQSMLTWARESVARGYVVLLIDALGPRNVDSVCMGPRNGVTFTRGAKDALQAAAHLRTLPYVNANRVALAGYSWGAMVGLLSSSPSALPSSPLARFAAIVSFYPGCFTLKPANGAAPYELVRPDIDRPLLVLMGALDTETPAQECLQKLQPLQAKGAPVELHLYPETTHCWDCKQLDGFSKVDSRGSKVTYQYSEDVTTDSRTRMFDFLAKVMPAP